jgi:hypothetical protein
MGVWTQGLHLESLHQPFLCDGCFRDRVSWTGLNSPICLGWLWTEIFLISTSWAAGITGRNHQCPASVLLIPWSELHHLLPGHCSSFLMDQFLPSLPPYPMTGCSCQKNPIFFLFFQCLDWTQALVHAWQALYHWDIHPAQRGILLKICQTMFLCSKVCSSSPFCSE